MTGFATEPFIQRWMAMELVEQLGNIGSEVERAIAWKKKGNPTLSASASDRSLQLMDLTIADPRWKGGKKKELCRMREVFCDAVLGENSYGTSDEFLKKYFLQFATAARRRSDLAGPLHYSS